MKLAEWRKLEDLTLQQVGKAVRVSAMSVSRIEKGVQRPAPELAKRIEKLTGGRVSAASLVGISEASATRGVKEDAAMFERGSGLTINVPVSTDQLRLLKKQGIDAEAVARMGAERAIKEAESRAWAEANREAIEASNAWIEKHGTLAEQLGLI